ncbi:MAG: hypothetical protein AAFX85_07355 [Pseudomonadota bacterium]
MDTYIREGAMYDKEKPDEKKQGAADGSASNDDAKRDDDKPESLAGLPETERPWVPPPKPGRD